MQWAHATMGRNRTADFWNHVVLPQGDSHVQKAQEVFEKIFRAVYVPSHEQNHSVPHHGPQLLNRSTEGEINHLLAFDGTRWYANAFALPRAFLQGYTPEGLDFHSSDGGLGPGRGRDTHWMHGYVSDGAELPSHIPHLDANQLNALHQEHIIPHWTTPHHQLREGRPSSFITPEDMKNMETVLPVEAHRHVRAAAQSGEPVIIHYMPETREWQDLTERYKFREAVQDLGIEPTARQTTHTESAIRNAAPRASETASAITHSASSGGGHISPQKASEATKGGFGKWAMIVGGIALGGIAVASAFGGKKPKEENNNKANAPTKDNETIDWVETAKRNGQYPGRIV